MHRILFVRSIVTILFMTGFAFSFEALGKVSAYKVVSFTIPVVSLTGEPTGRFEFNLSGEASLTLEATYVPKGEELRKKEIEEDGHSPSMMTQGKQVALLVSRYTDSYNLAGFYWSAGVGYRTVDGSLKKALEETTATPNTFSVGPIDDLGRASYEFRASGMTLHGRGGYRYVGQSVPFSIGLYLGVRHFVSKVEDLRTQSDEADPTLTELTSDEKNSIKRRFMDRPEGGLEVGVVF